MKRLSWTLVAVVAAGVFFLWRITPPRAERLDEGAWGDLAARTVPGAYHIHTTRSDGVGDRAAVAAAAARAGLKFVILTDHGDGTRPPDPPAYLDGVLVLDAVEISTDEGHYVALDMPRAPYPLGGAADSVVEDVTRLGGFGVAAHPDSPKAALRWTDERAPIDGIEWLNTDSEWRGEPRRRLAVAGLTYFLRPGPALASLFDRPATLDRWDRLTRVRQVVALAAADAHGGVGQRAEDPRRSLSGTVGIPSYEASFRVFSNRVVLDRPLSGNAAEDAGAVYGAIRSGRVFTAMDALAGPALLDFWVGSGLDRLPMGAALAEDSDATIVARARAPRGAEIRLVHDGQVLTRSTGELRQVLTGAKGAYRIEVEAPGAPGTPPIPWLVSNPIYIADRQSARGANRQSAKGAQGAISAKGAGAEGAKGAQGAISAKGAGAEGAKGAEGAEGARPAPPFPWRIEKDPSSSATLRTSDHHASLEYKLADGPRNSQFVALATDLHNQPFKVIELSLVGDRPLRVSVQVRRADGARWGRSFYVDPAGSTLRVPLSGLRPIGATGGSAISGADVTSILLVLDLANTAPGGSGVLRVMISALIN